MRPVCEDFRKMFRERQGNVYSELIKQGSKNVRLSVEDQVVRGCAFNKLSDPRTLTALNLIRLRELV